MENVKRKWGDLTKEEQEAEIEKIREENQYRGQKSKAKKEKGEFILEKPFIKIYEMRRMFPEKTHIRAYCSQFPDGWTFQIRGTTDLNDGFGAPRFKTMLATTGITIKEVEELLAFMKKDAKR